MTAHLPSLITETVVPVSTSMVILFPFMSNVIWYGFSLPVFSSSQNMEYFFGNSSGSVSVDTM